MVVGRTMSVGMRGVRATPLSPAQVLGQEQSHIVTKFIVIFFSPADLTQ